MELFHRRNPLVISILAVAIGAFYVPTVASAADADGDGIDDAFDLDIDGDGIPNPLHAVEQTSGSNPPVVSMPALIGFQNNANTTFSTANGNAITVTDPVSSANELIVTAEIPAGEGTLTLGSTAGLISSHGENTETITLWGDEAAVNAALDGLTLAATASIGNTEAAFNLVVDAVRVVEVGFENIGFETPLVPTTFIQTDAGNVAGWETDATDNKIELWKSGFQSVPSHTGDQFAELNANQVAALYQNGKRHLLVLKLSFTFAHRGRAGVDTMTATITDLGADGVVSADDTIFIDTKRSVQAIRHGLNTSVFWGIASGNPLLWDVLIQSAQPAVLVSGNFLDSIFIYDTTNSIYTGELMGVDSDGDGIPDFADLDSDNDGIHDVIESGGGRCRW